MVITQQAIIKTEPIQFFDGPPPHVGWWMTWIDRPIFGCGRPTRRYWRYWDGQNWSFLFDEDQTASDIERFFGISRNQKHRWSHYYPANARVPRVDPDKAGSSEWKPLTLENLQALDDGDAAWLDIVGFSYPVPAQFSWRRIQFLTPLHGVIEPGACRAFLPITPPQLP